ncbi:phospholipase D1-like [Limulus polyphemus]|uniref:Phospholipase n=1 Tax=Limulus polyphemus TaxID=6850 RepID=A0ABM1SSP9_LIMPO|nr:phospholipase D1-like [Limulus polyphemus]
MAVSDLEVNHHQTELDSDFEELNLPVTDDELDEDSLPVTECSRGISFCRIHEPTYAFDDVKQHMFIPHCGISIRISNEERCSTSHFLNPNLYIIEIQHGNFQWTVKRRYKHFHELHKHLRVYRAKMAIPIGTRQHQERRQSYHKVCKKKGKKSLPRFPQRPEALIAHDLLDRRRAQLEDYLKNLLAIPIYRCHPETLKFLEISPVSFIEALGQKGKEGLVKKRSGGHQVVTVCMRFKWIFFYFCSSWRKRWLVCKNNFIAYIRPRDGIIKSVLLMDQGFHVEQGIISTGIPHGLLISNLSRKLLVKCWTKRKQQEWAQYIMEVANTSARDFTQQNRYDSFAPVRNNVSCRWFIDGATYFEAVADALQLAQEEIFITDWWLSPEIYLKRPVIHGERWRLDKILQRKAQQGVKIFVLLYKEVELALGINSLYSKRQLVQQHPNIKVLRHPDHVPGGVLFWAHHEKIIAIDQTYAFIGGLDLCYGRWDDYLHRLTDLGGIAVNKPRANTVSPGIHASTSPIDTPLIQRSHSALQLDMLDSPSNPTEQSTMLIPSIHISSSLSVENISYQNQVTIQQATCDSDLPNAFEARKEDEEVPDDKGLGTDNARKTEIHKEQNTKKWKYIIQKKKHSENLDSDDDNPEGNMDEMKKLKDGKQEADDEVDEHGFKGRRLYSSRHKSRKVIQAVARLQALKHRMRRHSSGSIDSLNEGFSNTLNIPVGDLRQSTSEIALNELGLKGTPKLWFGKDYSNFIVKDFIQLEQPYQDLVNRNTTPRMPWHDIGLLLQGSSARDVSRHFIQRWNFTKFEKAKQYVKYPWLLPKAYDNLNNFPSLPKESTGQMLCANVQILRSIGEWSAGVRETEQSIHNAYIDIIQNAKHFIYIENQFFITQAAGNTYVFNEISEALYRRIIIAHKNKEKFRVYVVMPLLPAFEGELGTTGGTAIQAITHWNYASISRGPNSLLQRLSARVGDPTNYISFYGLRNHETLHNNLVTELVYVHSKMMIVDDRTVIIGSANINDRSLLGERDSEIAAVMEDVDFQKSIMNGTPYQAGVFAGTLRKSLFREHLGLDEKNSETDLRDPVSDTFYKDVWLTVAALNTSIFEKVFRCIPTDEVHKFAQIKTHQTQQGLAQTNPAKAQLELQKVRGHLVLLPLSFLSEEDLTPSSGTKEYFLPTFTWT